MRYGQYMRIKMTKRDTLDLMMGLATLIGNAEYELYAGGGYEDPARREALEKKVKRWATLHAKVREQYEDWDSI